MIKSVAELILYRQKTRKCGHFQSNLVGLKCKNITLLPDSQFRAKVKLPVNNLLDNIRAVRLWYHQ